MCADCGLALVDSLPPLKEAHQSTKQPEQTSPFLPGDDVVDLVTLAIVEAELVAAQLRVAGIPATVFGTGAEVYTGVRQARVMVRRSNLVEAERFLSELSAEERSGTPITDDELAALATDSTGGQDPASGAAV